MSEENNNHKPNFFQLYQKVGNIESDVKTALRLLEGHDKRISNIERTTNQIVGKITVVGAFFGMIGATIIALIKGKFFQ